MYFKEKIDFFLPLEHLSLEWESQILKGTVKGSLLFLSIIHVQHKEQVLMNAINEKCSMKIRTCFPKTVSILIIMFYFSTFCLFDSPTGQFSSLYFMHRINLISIFQHWGPSLADGSADRCEGPPSCMWLSAKLPGALVEQSSEREGENTAVDPSVCINLNPSLSIILPLNFCCCAWCCAWCIQLWLDTWLKLVAAHSKTASTNCTGINMAVSVFWNELWFDNHIVVQ